MEQFLHLFETLETHIEQIRDDLGDDWPEFAVQVQSLTLAFESAQDETTLARAVGGLYMACRAQEPIMTILRQTADTSGIGYNRRPAAGGADQEENVLVREIANRFQSLLARLEEMGLLAREQESSKPEYTNSGEGR
jgi:hypothetical protein